MSKFPRVYDDLYVGVFGPYAYEGRAMLTSTQVDPLREEAAITPQQLPLSAANRRPHSPIGRRLGAMHKRIATMLMARRIVQPPLPQFCDSVTDEQKARFNVVGPNTQTTGPFVTATSRPISHKCVDLRL